MGWQRVWTQRGVTMTGRTSVRCRSISNETEPEPMITAARSSTSGTGPSARTRPTSWRDDRWGDSSSSASEPSPPR